MTFEIPHALIPDSEHLGATLARLALTLVAAWLLQRLGFLLIWRTERWLVRASGEQPASKQRARTLGQTTRHLVTTAVAAGALVHALEVLGWDVKPFLVGASLLGAALGFGAQYLVRDVIAGAFILIENQYSVGDAIEINGTVATVEDVTLRSTRLRDYRGRLLFVPNGETRIVINHSRDWHRSLVDVPIAPDQDLGRALDAATAAAAALRADASLASRWLEPPQAIGLERVGPEGLTVRVALRTAPGAAAAESARAARRIVIEHLREAGIRLASVPPRVPGDTPGA
jgi:small-conductance mechanosensitive channel